MKRLLNVVLAWSAVAAAPLLSTTAHAALGVCDALPADNVEVEATAGTPGPTSYNTLKLAFDAINAGTHQGSINIEVCGNTTEAASAVLNASGSGAALYTDIAIKPVGGAARTLAGTLAGAPLIDLNGADAVTIDGLNAGGNSLTLQNASTAATAGTSTVRFIGGASGNTITRTAVQGSSLVPLATAGGTITFSTDTVALTGNDNNTISFCDIGPVGAALPIKAVFGLGTTTTLANYNSGVVIDHNNIFDFFGTGAASVSGIHVLGGNDAWTISNNKLYQTAPRTFTATARYAGITLSGTTTGGAFTVTGNTIGFGASNGTGTTTISGGANEFRGIDAVTTNITTPTVYQNNIVSGINQSTSDSGTTTSASFIGITLGTSDGRYNAIGNQVGSLDGSSTIVLNNSTTTSTLVYGIFDFSFQSNTIANNSIGSITIQGTGTATGFRGILWNTGAALTETVTNNTVGSATGPIVDLQVGNNSVYGFNGVSAAANLSGNTASYLSANSISAATPIVTVAGYIIGSTSTTVPSTIARNSAHHLSNNAGVSANGGSVYGISASLPTTLANVVERNLLHTFDATATNTAYQLAGIVASAGTTTYRNNIVSLGFNAAGNPITAGYVILGLFDPVTGTATTSQFYYNSVFIGGSGVTAPGSNSYALYSNVVTNPRNFQNNILWNTRGNAVAGGSAHLAIRIGATTAGLTSNYNDLLADGTDGAVGVFNATIYPTLANWQTATTQDPLSLSVNPMFVALTNLHLQPGSPAIAMGTSIAGITDDFDGDLRPAVNPSIGADEFVPGHITIAPASFDFGNQTVGVPSAPTSITLSNTGGAPLSVTAITAAASPFSAAGGTCGPTPITIAVGASCTLDYTFTPTAAGPASQPFTVTANVAGDTTFTLSGTGLPVTHTVTSSVGTPSGTITPPSAVVNDGATTAFTVTANPGFHFDTIGGTCPAGSMAGNTYTTGAITADCTVVANFAADIVTHTVTSSVGTPSGTITPPSVVVNDGATAAFTVTANPGFHFDTIGGTCPAGSMAGSTYTTGAITADCTVVANFAADGGGSDTFSNNNPVNIPDDAYNGTQASMACSAIDASSLPAGDTVTSVTITTGLTHTWAGDLVAKLFSPSGSVLAVFSRPGFAEPADDGTGGFGDSSNLLATSPLMFNDAAAADAETMGGTLASSGVICQDDSVCSYHANHGAAAGLTSFAGFNGGAASGTWTLCVGDAGGGDTGSIQNWSITIGHAGAVTHTVTSSVGTPSGTITPPSVVVNDGATAAFTVTANAGFHFDTIGGTCPAGSMAGNTYTTGAIIADCTVVANFAPDVVTHTVTSSVGTPSGTITPPSVVVNDGATAAFTVTANAGFHFDTIGGTCPAGSMAGNTYT
ncbi:beta strand repeat-containing protein, partial [Dokdonella sp.]|uniref:beta strand repeat-containing protein n=1 Tax=Dokdonella sp. TaxID=2291710 RepID=UPI003784BF8A